MTLEDMARSLVLIAPLHTLRELEAHSERVPAGPGVYAWFFDDIDADWNRQCVTREGRKLLYVGVSTGSERKQGLRGRIMQNHVRGNAAGSTLRQSLGAILGIALCLVDGSKTFGDAEARLTEWILEHGRVCWVETNDPRALEHHLLDTITLPLNIQHNPRNPFREKLSAMRRPAKRVARSG